MDAKYTIDQILIEAPKDVTSAKILCLAQEIKKMTQLKPKEQCDSERRDEIARAILRCLKNDIEVPKKWIEEYQNY